jgi:hypothetical protein
MSPFAALRLGVYESVSFRFIHAFDDRAYRIEPILNKCVRLRR